MKLRLNILLLASALLIAGCAHYPVNMQLRAATATSGYRFQNVAPTNSDDLLVMLAFSGGGTRAAALSYGVLEELRRTEVGPRHNEHPLLDDVGLIFLFQVEVSPPLTTRFGATESSLNSSRSS